MTVGGPFEDSGRHERLLFLEYVDDSHDYLFFGFVSVAVTISVACSAVSVLLVLDVNAVEDHGHVLVLLRLVEILDDRKDTLVHQTCSHHEYRHVNCLCNDARIGYEVDRRTVEEDIVELASHIFNKVLEVGAIDEAGYNTMVENYNKLGTKDRAQFETELTTTTPTAIMEAQYGAEQNGVKMQYIYQYASETNKELFAEGENATIIISMCEVAGKKIAKLPAKKASIVDVFLKK